MIANLAGPDLVILVLVILVVLVGGSQLPKIARNVGLAGREFRKAQQEAEEEAAREQAAKTATPPPPVPLGTGETAASGPATPTSSSPEERVTLSRAELDALLKAREEETKRTAGGSSN